LVLFNLSEVFKIPAGPTDGPIVLNAGDSEYVSSTIAIPSSRGMVEGLRGLNNHLFKEGSQFLLIVSYIL
jgi:hypothetical protein